MSNPLGCSSLACLLLMSFLVLSMAMTNTLESKNWLSDYLSDTLISPTQKFQLGFFTPNKSSNGSRVARYVGIWYYNNPDIIVWVANRDNPILDSPGLIQITADGKFIITDEKNVTKWSSGSITNSGGSSSAIFYLSLQDSGNLVLSRQHENAATATLWQSFDHPTDTFIPGMRMDQNNKINLTSWRSEVDPSSGDFSFQQDPAQVEQYCILSRDNYRWKSGSSGRFRSGKFISDEIPNLMSDLLSNTTTPKRSIPDANPKLLPHPNIHVNETRLRMKFDGTLELLGITNQSWLPYWSQPTDNCGVFEACGKFSVCSTTHKDGLNYTCKCLPGCQPTSPDNWASGQFSQGCGRVASTCSENFTSLTITRIQRPVQPLQPNERIDANECRSKCISSCCNGYAYTQTENLLRDRSSNRTCWLWKDELSNVISETDAEVDDQQVFYFRVSEPNLEIQNSNEPQRTWEKKKPPLSLTLPGSVAVALVTACTIFILYHQLKRRRGIQQGNRQSTQGNLSLQLYDSESRLKAFMGSSEVGDDDNKGIEVPSFDLDAIKFATKNFSDENKLGQGGFGPVYKGSFTAGQEIAIKRLSSTSGQGLEEFKNEILLIAKLQHRNLVRLLGYCAEGYEKLLIYEYMPNKSLDSFIFDRTRCVLLNWEKRFNIILGIARGMLYLHQDSRLRIIHRDLKTSNVLLDKDMNPKISDFGLARIFGGTQTEAATNRVVGTYGYMSPEYAVDGFFSVKSDVFSFGVVILEILSGKRNTGFYRSKQPFSLLSHAWRLWKEGKPLELMDQTLMETVNGPEFKRCLTIGLLCVEEDPGDRPTMSSAVYMLGNESEAVTMPEPKQPAFVLVERSTNSTSSVSTSAKMEPSNVELTITVQDGR